jgi:hypothetical protein
MRTLEKERKDRQVIEMKAVALVRNNKTSWEKKHREEVAALEKHVEVCITPL